jgi:dolichol-phosphate mannosyltransferase
MSKFSSISIVVPTWNEQDSVETLVKAIHNALSSQEIEYELIFVDDHSTDSTVLRLNALAKKFPIRIYTV